MRWLKRSAIGLLRARASWRSRARAAVLWVARHRERHGVARAAARRRRAADHDRAHPRLAARRLALEGVRMRTARDELDIDSLALEWNGRRAARRACSRSSAPMRRARRIAACPASHARRRRPARAAVAAARRARSVATLSITVARAHAAVRRRRRFAAHLRRPPARAHGRRDDVRRRRARRGRHVRARATASSSTSPASGRAPLAGVAASGTVELTGTWPELRIRHELAAPFAATTTGTLDRRAVPRRRRQRSGRTSRGPASTASRARAAGSRSPARSTTYRYDGAGALDVVGRAASFTVEGTGERLLLALAQLELRRRRHRAAARCAPPAAVSLESRDDEPRRRGEPTSIRPGSSPRGRGGSTARARCAPASRRSRTPRSTPSSSRGELRGYPVTLRRRGGVDGPRPRAARRAAPRLRREPRRADGRARPRAASTSPSTRSSSELDLLVPDVAGALTADRDARRHVAAAARRRRDRAAQRRVRGRHAASGSTSAATPGSPPTRPSR